MAKGPFKLRSGNKPLKFKQMGATPAKHWVWGGDKYHGEGKHPDEPHKEEEESPTKDMKTGSYAHKFEDDSKNTPAYLKEFGVGKGTSPYHIPPPQVEEEGDGWLGGLKKIGGAALDVVIGGLENVYSGGEKKKEGNGEEEEENGDKSIGSITSEIIGRDKT